MRRLDLPRAGDDVGAAFDELEESLRELQWAAMAIEQRAKVSSAVLSARVSYARSMARLLRHDLLNL